LLGFTHALSAKVSYHDGTSANHNDTISWKIDNSDVARLNSSYDTKSLKGLKAGEVTLTAKLSDLSTSKTFKVIAPTSISISSEKSDEMQLGQSKLIAKYSDDTQQTLYHNVSWEIDNNDISKITISYRDASLQALKIGEVSVTARYDDLIASKKFTILEPVYKSFYLDYGSDTMYIGESKKLQALASYSDGSRRDIVDSITWQVMSNIATVTNDGTVTGLK